MFKWLIQNKRKAIFIFLIILVVVLFLSYYLGSKRENNFVVQEIDHQDLANYLSETGTVQQGKEVFLSFNQSGQIDELYVLEGEEVDAGQSLISFDRGALIIELERAQESLVLAQADYQKLLTGLSIEELNYYQVSLQNAEISLNNTRHSLLEAEDEKAETERKVLVERNGLYDGALSTAKQAIDTGLNSLLFLIDIQQEYFPTGTSDALALSAARGQAALSLVGAKNSIYWSKASLLNYFGGARELADQADTIEEIDLALIATIDAIEDVKSALNAVKVLGFSSEDLILLNTEKTSINSILASLMAHQQSISAHWVNSDILIKSAERAIQNMERQVETAQGNYELSLAQWEIKSSPPRAEDEVLYSARVKQAQAEVKLMERRLSEAVLKAPFRGRVVEILKQRGETAQLGQAVVKLRPSASFQIEVDIYEGDIGQVKVGQKTEIELVAFPNMKLFGQVSFIDSSSRLINNVVYYPIKIELNDDSFDNLQTGLTADVKIILESKENVLTVPESALIDKDGRMFVRILTDLKQVEEREIEVGMRGEGFRVEIVSGLTVGEKVIVR